MLSKKFILHLTYSAFQKHLPMRQQKKWLVNALIFDPASLKDAQVCARHKI
jgi:hypothetical protein